MKITVESLGLPTITAVIGKKTKFDFKGGTVADFVDQLIGCFGTKDREMLLDAKGQLNPTIQVMVNEGGFLTEEKFLKHWRRTATIFDSSCSRVAAKKLRN